MENILSNDQLQKKIRSSKKSFLLLYKKGNEQSQCAYDSLSKVTEENVTVFVADVNTVRDIHEQYGITTVPSLLLFNEGSLEGVVKGCYDTQYYNALAKGDHFKSQAGPGGESTRKRVTVYSTPTCSWCNTLKAWLNKNNIGYRDIDISADQKAAEELVRRSGQQGVPQTDINGRIVVGFDQPKLKELLGI
jgi:glutaredoxin-like YruB-family protein